MTFAKLPTQAPQTVRDLTRMNVPERYDYHGVLEAVKAACRESNDGWARATRIRQLYDGKQKANKWATRLWEMETLGHLERRKSPNQPSIYEWRPSSSDHMGLSA